MVWRRWRPGFVAVAGALSLLARSAAGAPNDGDAARHAELLRQGAAAAKAQRWDACIQALTEAVEINNTPAALGGLGLCEEQAGRYARAHDHLRRAMEAAPPSAKAEPWKGYQAALAKVNERVALLIITIQPPSARVIIDGRPIGQGDGQTIAVEPGKHTVVGRLEGYKEKVVVTDDVRAGGTPNIGIVLEPLPRAPAASASAAPTVRPQPLAPLAGSAPPSASNLFRPAWSPRGVLVTLAYAGAATALVSGATAIGFEVHYQSMASRLDTSGYQRNTCRKGEPPANAADCAEIVARIGQRDISANVLIGSAVAFGALSGAAGLAMYLDRSPLGPKVTATASANGGGIVVLGTW